MQNANYLSFPENDSGVSSMANSHPTSSEENTPNHRVKHSPIKKKKGAIHSLMDLKMKRIIFILILYLSNSNIVNVKN